MTLATPDALLTTHPAARPSRRLRLLVLVNKPLDTAPAQRFRIEQWARYLCDQGVEIAWDVLETPALNRVLYQPGRHASKTYGCLDALARRWGRLRERGRYDVAFISRETSLIGPAWIERSLHRAGLPYVFDFDDSIFLRTANSPNPAFQFAKCAWKTADSCRRAAHVTVATEFLAEYARRHSSTVSVVPTTIDTDQYRTPVNCPANSLPVIGWSGSMSTVPFLLALAPALRQLATQRRFRLLIIGAVGIEIPGLEVECTPWRAATEVPDLARMDIGVYPLPDDEWTRGKGGLKLCQYMAMGIPAVAADIPQNRAIVQHGRNGLLAASQREWIEALTGLLDNRGLRQQLGTAGRATVVADWSLRAWAPRVYSILLQAARPSAAA